MEEGVLSVAVAFGDLQDPRSRTPVHDLSEILPVSLCAILCGVDSWLGIQMWVDFSETVLYLHRWSNITYSVQCNR
jgi:hypothetical protein